MKAHNVIRLKYVRRTAIFNFNIHEYQNLIKRIHLAVCRRFGLLMFWFINVLVYGSFDLSTFRFVEVLTNDPTKLKTTNKNVALCEENRYPMKKP